MQVARPELDFTLCSPDPVAAARFYVDVFGARVLQAEDAPSDTAAGVRLGGHGIFFAQAHEGAERLPGHIYAATGLRVLAILLDDLDATCAMLAGLGRRTAPTRGLPGQLRVTFAKDFDGNVLELIGLAEPQGDALATRMQVGLTVSDVARSRAFYAGRLGLPEQRPTPIEPGITRYACTAGQTTIKFWSTGKPLPGPPEKLRAAIGIRAIRIPASDADEVVRLSDTGTPATLRDPDGTLIQLVGPD